MPHKDPEARRAYYRKRMADPAYAERKRERGREWYRSRVGSDYRGSADRRAEQARRARERSARLKAEAFEAYGGASCGCCGEVHVAMLTLDHIDGQGSADRGKRGEGSTGAPFYLRLKRAGWPPGFQVLCFNCNYAKHLLGACPHGGAK